MNLLDPRTILQQALAESHSTWEPDRVILYHLGVGAGAAPSDELRYLYERDLEVLPTFALASIMDHLGDFAWLDGTSIDPSRVRHVGHELILSGPLPTHGRVSNTGRLIALYDRGTAAELVFEVTSRDVDGGFEFVNRFRLALLDEGGFGGEPPPPAARELRCPRRPPDRVVEVPVPPHLPALYRLSGDKNDLHVDPEVARRHGLSAPPLHGACTLGIVTRVAVDQLLGGRGARIGRIHLDFGGPAFPDEALRVELWREGERIHLRARARDRGTPVIVGAVIELTPLSASLAGDLEASARATPDATAVVGPDGRRLSYRELEERASRIAGFLQSKGIGPGDRVGMLLPKDLPSVCVIFGILKARAAYVPVDLSAPRARVRSILDGCGVSLAFVHADRADALDGPGELPFGVVLVGGYVTGVAATPWAHVLAHPRGRDTTDGRRPDDLAYVLYTSGSTGVPKGVMLTQANAIAFVDWCTASFHPTSADRFGSHAPYTFDLSILDVFGSLRHGAQLHLVSEALAGDPFALAAFIAERRLTVWYSAPSILGLLAEFGELHERDYSALRLVLFAGEVFPVERLRRLTEAWPHPSYFNLYGPTETNICTFAAVETPIPPERTRPFPIGPACSHCTALVLDPATGEEVPVGGEGLLYISGAAVFSGYWGLPERTAAAFIERAGRRWYSTGDLVRHHPTEGFVFVGRIDRMVKRRGYRIELGEIEHALHRHPAVREVAAVASDLQRGDVYIVAHLTARADQRPDAVELRRFCGEHLPAYMVPDAFRYHAALPRTPTDKVDYQALPAEPSS